MLRHRSGSPVALAALLLPVWLLGACGAGSAAAGELQLVRDGKAVATIVRPR